MIAAATSPHDLVLTECAKTTIHHKARRLIGRFGFTSSDLQDLEQDLTLDLFRRAAAFDPAKAQWSTFSSRCIDHRIADIIRFRCTEMRDPERTCHLEDGDTHHHAPLAPGGGDPARPLDLHVDLTAALAQLPANLQRLCQRLITTSVSSIAAEDGRSRWHVYQDIARIRRAFAAAGLTTYC